MICNNNNNNNNKTKKNRQLKTSPPKKHTHTHNSTVEQKNDAVTMLSTLHQVTEPSELPKAALLEGFEGQLSHEKKTLWLSMVHDGILIKWLVK